MDSLTNEADLPIELAWLVASYDRDIKQRCHICKNLWRTHAIVECQNCYRTCHRGCSQSCDRASAQSCGRAIANDIFCFECLKILPKCVVCERSVSDEIECKKCNAKFHRSCRDFQPFFDHLDDEYDSELIVNVCEVCLWKDAPTCAFCETLVPNSNPIGVESRCGECDRVACYRHMHYSRCFECHERIRREQKLREYLLIDRLDELAVDVSECKWLGSRRAQTRFVSGSDPELEEAVFKFCQDKLFHDFCDSARFSKYTTERHCRALLAPLCPTDNANWPWLLKTTVADFQAQPVYQRILETVNRREFRKA